MGRSRRVRIETKTAQALGYKEKSLIFVYVLRDPRNYEIFYVGVTCQPTLRGLSRRTYGGETGARIREIRDADHRPTRILFGVFNSREQALYQECVAIKLLEDRGVKLLNSVRPSPTAFHTTKRKLWECSTTRQ